MNTIRNVLSALGGDPAAAALREGVVASLGPNDVDTLAEAMDAIDQLEDLAGTSGSIAAAVANVHEPADPDAPIVAGIHLLNAHTGKGQQFDWVIIPGLEKGNVPSFLARTAAEKEEEHRVLLVMLSRARHGVMITCADSLISRKNKPYSTTQSPWQDDLRAGIHANAQDVLEHIKRLSSQTLNVGSAP
ncbi:3'-5' exonuclease [Microbacterium sp.]|uniref:3'-5' exonuclease n=1 Tax=Microbacterium sp. TaxID=51671 RepID=UPI003F9D0814